MAGTDIEPYVAISLGSAFIIYMVQLVVWNYTRGTVGDNRFGPDPLAIDPL